jgi:hypothetical protein
MRTLLALAILGVPLAFFGAAAFAAGSNYNYPDYPGPKQYARPVVQTGPTSTYRTAGPDQAPTTPWWQRRGDDREGRG